MKTIICGSRTTTDPALLALALSKCGWEVTEVICGEARGGGYLGAGMGRKHDIPVRSFFADWDKHGKAAGFIRNHEGSGYPGVWSPCPNGFCMVPDERLPDGAPGRLLQEGCGPDERPRTGRRGAFFRAGGSADGIKGRDGRFFSK